MKLKGKIPMLIVASLAWVVVISSCANIGMPTGGPKDTIPPTLLETSPEYKALNYDGNEVRFTFNEYIATDEISEALVISPPLKKKPSIRTRSKTLIIQFNEDLKDSVTYSLDFKNSVADNNEKNPIENLRFSFSTGPVYDSLRVAGRLETAFDMEPVENGLILLQSNLHDSAVFKLIPDYIAKTDEAGMFMIDNIAPGSYNIFALNDLNNDMLYNEGAEEIAFLDSLIVPHAEFHESLDTVAKGLDSMLILGYTHFYPEPLYLRYFMEDIFEQYLDKSEREDRNKLFFHFNESVQDTLGIRLIGYDKPDWYLMEHNKDMDSIVVWIADSSVFKQDTLPVELSYIMLDSMNEPYVFCDTLLMEFSTPKLDPKKGRKNESTESEEKEEVIQFNWQSNVGGTMELNSVIRLTSPEPVAAFDSTMIHLYLAEDTLKNPLNFSFRTDTNAWRTYLVTYDWEPETKYTLSIDSAACVNIYGITSKQTSRNFQIREEDYYGSITLEMKKVNGPMIAQLLKNNKDEEVIRQQVFEKDGPVTFSLLAPDKYKIKIIYDDNGNGKWDPGSYQDKLQPERVVYLNELIKLRSNWNEIRPWDITYDETYVKKIIDQEAEEAKRKAAEEKAKKEQQGERSNSMFGSGESSGGVGSSLRNIGNQ